MPGLGLSKSRGPRQDLKCLTLESSLAMLLLLGSEREKSGLPVHSLSLMKPNFLSKPGQKWPLHGEPLSARGRPTCPGIEI